MERFDKTLLSEMLYLMWKIRLFEEEAEYLYHQGLVRGALHLYIGEEAVAVGICSALDQGDYIISGHRGHGHCIAMHGKLDRMMAELLGRESGYCKGRGGSMHLADIEKGILICSGIVGAGIPIAVGSAFSSYYRNENKVTVCFFGDGASNQGTFHESLNIAALWKLPIIFICENNLYAITVPASASLPIKNIADRSVSYGIRGNVVDGMNVLEIYQAAKREVEKARNGGGPSLIECKTYRFKGHWVGDPIVYRTEDEVREWRKKDPIILFIDILKKDFSFSDANLNDIKKQAEEEVKEAVNFAKNSEFPKPEDLLKYVYC